MTDFDDPPVAEKTPWQRVFHKFGVSQSEFGRLIGRDKSKISRHLSDDDGLISGPDQVLILTAAHDAGVELEPRDLLPWPSDA